jgi:lysophospholipase L1-like esterase
MRSGTQPNRPHSGHTSFLLIFVASIIVIVIGIVAIVALVISIDNHTDVETLNSVQESVLQQSNLLDELKSSVDSVGSLLITTNLSANSNQVQLQAIQSQIPALAYVPLTNWLNERSVEFYGDSITYGYLLSSPTTQRWSHLLCEAMNCTELNYGVVGAQINDLIFHSTSGTSYTSVYDNHVDGNTAFVAMGFNDIVQNAVADNVVDELRRTLESVVMFLSLPVGKTRTNARSGVASGNWVGAGNIGSNYGLCTDASTYTNLTQTISGRYVGFTVNMLVGDAPRTMAIIVDGVTINTVLAFFTKGADTSHGSFLNEVLYLYDTGVNGTGAHTLVLQPTIGSTVTLCVGSFVGFNHSQSGSNAVFLLSTEPADFGGITSTGNTGGAEYRRLVLNTIIRTIALNIRQTYGLPIYFVDTGNNFVWGSKADDGVHPNPMGHQYIANRIEHVIHAGEYTYS